MNAQRMAPHVMTMPPVQITTVHMNVNVMMDTLVMDITAQVGLLYHLISYVYNLLMTQFLSCLY